MDPNKRGNPPFEPSSYAAGLERRVKRCERWSSKAREAAKWLLDGTEHERQFAEAWWREQLNQPEVVLSKNEEPHPMTDIPKLARSLSEAERVMIGGSWRGSCYEPHEAIQSLNAKELMHIDMLKHANGRVRRWKARPTPLGLQVRAYLESQQT